MKIKKIMAISVVLSVLCQFLFTSTVLVAATGAENTYTLIHAKEAAIKSSLRIKQADLDVQRANDSIVLRSLTSGLNENIRQRSIDYLQAVTERNKEASENYENWETQNLYDDLIISEKTVELYKENLELTQELYNRNKANYDEGLLDKNRFLTSELSLINAQRTLQMAQSNLAKVRTEFEYKTGEDLNNNLKALEDISIVEFIIPKEDEAIGKAVNNRNEIKAVEYKLEIDNLNKRLTKEEFGEDSFEYNEACYRVDKVQLELVDVKKEIKAEIKTNLINLKQKENELESLSKSIGLTEQILEQTKNKFDIELINAVEVESAKKSVLEARLSWMRGILDYNLAILNLKDSMGIGRNSVPVSLLSKL